MSSPKTFEELRVEWPGLAFDVHRTALGVLDSVGVLVVVSPGEYRVFTLYGSDEAKLVAAIEAKLALLRKALTPVGIVSDFEVGDAVKVQCGKYSTFGVISKKSLSGESRYTYVVTAFDTGNGDKWLTSGKTEHELKRVSASEMLGHYKDPDWRDWFDAPIRFAEAVTEEGEGDAAGVPWSYWDSVSGVWRVRGEDKKEDKTDG